MNEITLIIIKSAVWGEVVEEESLLLLLMPIIPTTPMCSQCWPHMAYRLIQKLIELTRKIDEVNPKQKEEAEDHSQRSYLSMVKIVINYHFRQCSSANNFKEIEIKLDR